MIFASTKLLLLLNAAATLARPTLGVFPRAGSMSILKLVNDGIIPSSVLKLPVDKTKSPPGNGTLHPDGHAKCTSSNHQAADSSIVMGYFKTLATLTDNNPDSNFTIAAKSCAVLGCRPGGDAIACNRNDEDLLAFHKDFVRPGIAAVSSCTDITEKVRFEQPMTGGVIVYAAAPPADKPYCGF